MKGTYRSAIEKHGSFRKAAKALGLPASTLQNRLAAEETVIPEAPKPGVIRARDTQRRPLPKKGAVKRYIVTSAQSNTGVFDLCWNNLLAFADFYDAEILVGATTYRVTEQSAKGQKTGRETPADESEWWADEVMPYLANSRVELAPGLVWCGELNILPTAVDPISGLESYTGAASAIFPHAKFAVKSIASPKGKDAKIAYTTGCVTLRNYIQKKAGQKAEFHHGYGALIVEVCCDGSWFVRQLNADSEGVIYDLDKRAASGKVTVGHRVKALVWGDIHVRRLAYNTCIRYWGERRRGGILDVFRPEVQVVHDVLDFRSQNHHDRNDPWIRHQKHTTGGSSVYDEVAEAAEFLSDASRKWCETIVVRSNHDEALVRWLKEGDWKTDPENARFFLRANLAALDAYAEGNHDFDAIEWAIRDSMPSGDLSGVRFLRRDEDFVVCPDASGGIDLSMHGDKGANGTRGSVPQYAKMGRKCIIGHGHSAWLHNGAMAVGAAELDHGYNVGPSSWSKSHALVYANGKRTLITERNGRLYADDPCVLSAAH